MRVPILAANWKMNLNRREARNLVDDLLAKVLPLKGRELVIGAPFHMLVELAPKFEGKPNCHLSGQDMYWKESGAFTGEISAAMLRDCGCSHVIIGHSERRALFHETDSDCAKKVEAALNNGLVPILCVGETLEQREAGRTKDVVVSQLEGALRGSKPESGDRLVVAYEPVWAIGTGKNDSPPEADKTMGVIRETIGNLLGERIAQQVRLLYGGSVKPNNIDAFMACPHIDGALVGGASLEAESFARIVNYLEAAGSAAGN